jgi:opacity protein-like surface antigen
MKQLFLVLIALAIIANLAFAGDDSIPKSKSGDKAVLFTLSGLSNLGAASYMGGLGGKYYISDGNAIRASLGFGTSTTTTKPPAGSPAGAVDQKSSSSAFIIAPAFLHNINANGPVLAYIGGEFAYIMTSTTVENPGFVANNKNHSSTTGFGVAGIFGVEWFAWNNISLSAEYVLAYTSSSGTTETTVGGTTTTVDNPSTTTFAIGQTGIIPTINFTLAVFW